MSGGFGFWLYENVLFPLLPLCAAIAALELKRLPVTVVALFGDGGLMFYATSLSFSLGSDALKDVEARSPTLPTWLDNSLMAVSLIAVLASSFVFGMIALARADEANAAQYDSRAYSYDSRAYSTWSWIAALVVAIYSTLSRALTGLY